MVWCLVREALCGSRVRPSNLWHGSSVALLLSMCIEDREVVESCHGRLSVGGTPGGCLLRTLTSGLPLARLARAGSCDLEKGARHMSPL